MQADENSRHDSQRTHGCAEIDESAVAVCMSSGDLNGSIDLSSVE